MHNIYTPELFSKPYSNEQDRIKAVLNALNGGVCPRCGSNKMYVIQTRPKGLICGNKHAYSPLSSTIMKKSELPLEVWFAVMHDWYTRGELNAMSLMRIHGVAYKTAWRLAKLVRENVFVPGLMRKRALAELNKDHTIVL